MALQFVISKKGNNQLVHDGFVFTLNKTTETKCIWECSERRLYKCTSRVHTANQRIISYNDEHNHRPTPENIQAKTIVAKIKQYAIESPELATKAIVTLATSNLPASITAACPSVELMKDTAQRAKRKQRFPLTNPTTLAEIEIPNKFRKTVRDENFVLYDSGPNESRIIIFGTERNLELLERCQNWYADGTFKIAPALFTQLYTIHALYQNNVIPLVFALLPDKSEATYTRLFSTLKELNPRLNPASLMIDFERAVKNAFQAIFPQCEQAGCFFHFGQCLWRNLQKHPDLSQQYKSSPEFAATMKCLNALAFVPPQDVVAAYEVLLQEEFFSNNPSMEVFLKYFEENWIGTRKRGRGRATPKIPIGNWNCFYRVVDGVAKTNNNCEGWNRGFQTTIGGFHPTIWRLIEGLKQEQSINEVYIIQSLSGQAGRPTRKKYEDLARKIKVVVEDFGNRPIMEYLRGISHNLK